MGGNSAQLPPFEHTFEHEPNKTEHVTPRPDDEPQAAAETDDDDHDTPQHES